LHHLHHLHHSHHSQGNALLLDAGGQSKAKEYNMSDKLKVGMIGARHFAAARRRWRIFSRRERAMFSFSDTLDNLPAARVT
jgi:hypothetical protein